MSDHDLPPGWNNNPSSWPQRLPIVGLALVGFGIATYLALYQYGVFATVWEPFFGEGSRVVLHSRVSDAIEQVGGLLIVFALVPGKVRTSSGAVDQPSGGEPPNRV